MGGETVRLSPMKLTELLERLTGPGYLDGHFLVAMPSMPDPRFQRAVIYICAHSDAGAMGLIINHPADDVRFFDLLVQLNIIPEGTDITLPPGHGAISVVKGGPVEPSRGIVLHSDDVMIANATMAMDDGVCLTATLDIIRAIAAGQGPRDAILALGYAAWAPGQLERELQANGWLVCAADRTLVFDPDISGKYQRILRHLGADPTHLSSQTGHA